MSAELINISIMEVSAETYFGADERIQELIANIDLALAESKEIEEIITTGTLQDASHYFSNYGKLETKLEATRKEITSPILNKKTEIDEYFKKLSNKFTQEKSRLKEKILSFQKKQEETAKLEAAELRKKEEEENLRLAIEKEAELKAAAVAKGEDPSKVKVEVPIVAETVIEAPKLSQINSSGVSSTKIKKWKVVDLKKVPFEHLIVDEKKISALRKGYAPDAKSPIPGIEFYSEASLRR